MKNIRPVWSWTESNSYGLNAAVAGEIVGRLKADVGEDNLPQRLVEEARSDAHPMHPMFQWDDDKAAHAFRLHQARRVISSLRVQFKESDRPMPAFFNVVSRKDEESGPRHVYVSTQAAMAKDATRQAIVESELKRILQMLARVQAFPEFAPLIRAAREVEAGLFPLAQAAD